MRENKFTRLEVGIVAVVLCAISAITLPKFSQAGTDDRLDTLCSNLQLVRSKLSLYRIQHQYQWPRQATFAAQLTSATNAQGTTDAADGPLVFMPYLKSIPVNPFTGGNAITGGDWSYDETTGRFTADDGGATEGIVHKNL